MEGVSKVTARDFLGGDYLPIVVAVDVLFIFIHGLQLSYVYPFLLPAQPMLIAHH
jgi:hypothetical protein